MRMTESAKSELITGGAGLDCEVAFTATGQFYNDLWGNVLHITQGFGRYDGGSSVRDGEEQLKKSAGGTRCSST